MENTSISQPPTGGGDESPLCSPVGHAQSTTEATTAGPPGPESDVAMLGRLVADALRTGVSVLRNDHEIAMAKFTRAFQEELSVFREGEEKWIARLDKAITALRPNPTGIDPATHFWTVYRKVADEYDSDMVAKYVGDLDTSLLFAGLFSAVSATFIAQIIPSIQPNPSDLTNALLLRILQHNASFHGADPLAPIANIPKRVVRAQSILFASLTVTLFVAFIAVLGKQWILYYTRTSTRGSIVDRGAERQLKFAGLQKWGLHVIMELLPVMLQFALFLFSIGIIVFLWDLDTTVAKAVLLVTCIGCLFYLFVVVSATIWKDCPFKTPFSILLPKLLSWTKKVPSLVRSRLRRRRIHVVKNRTGPLAEDAKRSYPVFSDPALWRHDPLFTPALPEDTSATAGFWLLEHSTGLWATNAVAAVFQEFQWPSHHDSPTALIRLRDTYVECLRPQKLKKSNRLAALQSAAAYYVLYHTQVLWNTTKSLEVEVEKLPAELPSDLLCWHPDSEWDDKNLFEYLLGVKDRSEPVESARFLSYIAPYWYCGDPDSTEIFLDKRLSYMGELIQVLEDSKVLNHATLTECLLCIGATIDFPLHPEDLIRVDKSDYIQLTFKNLIEHIHGTVLSGVHEARYAGEVLEIILTLVEKKPFPPVDVGWVYGLLRSAAEGGMGDEVFAQFLRLRGFKAWDPVERTEGPETANPEDALFDAISNAIKFSIDQGESWEDKVMHSGLMAIKDMLQPGSYLPDDDFLDTLFYAMGSDKPLPVRKAAFNVIQGAQEGWLTSTTLRETLQEQGGDFLGKLYRIIRDTQDSVYRYAFLDIIETLSTERGWHYWLREKMDIWVPFGYGGQQTARILANIGEIPFPDVNDPENFSLADFVTNEWKRVPGRGAESLTTDRLTPFAEVTERLKRLLFNDTDRRAVLVAVEDVIPSLERRRNHGHDRLGGDIRGLVDRLLAALRAPGQGQPRPASTAS